jgi:DNA damage-binding protein 1
MEVVGEFRLGEVVNKIVPTTSAPGASQAAKEQWQLTDSEGDKVTEDKLERTGPVVTPRAFIGTVEGAIYMLASINPAFVNVLLLLQSSLATRIQAPGYMPWSKYRAWKTEVSEKDEPFRFVDGEMLEQALLALTDRELEDILREAGLMEEKPSVPAVSVAEVRAWGEELRRLY